MIKRFRVGAIIALTALVLSLLQGTLGTFAQSAEDDGIGQPLFTEVKFNGSVSHTAITIPYWGDSFTYQGQTYPYTMVGTNPATGGSSTVTTEIIPLSFNFSTGQTLDGTKKVALTTASPIFQTADYISGTGIQYGDAIMRAGFWSTGGSSDSYHVLLGQPTILPTVSIDVPANQGLFTIGHRSGAPIGLMDIQWFSSHLTALLGQLHIASNTVPIFLTYNTFLYITTPGNCCVLGYHGAQNGVAHGGSQNGNGNQQIQTFIYAAFSDPGIFRSSMIQDIHGLSHEVSEWLMDPFTNNLVPPWSVPTAPQYGCTNLLESGDPVVGIGFPVTLSGVTYHPEDEVFYSWFARESPSRGINGQYTYMGTFNTFAPGC